jgi:Cdc6-like AAA superfamily ATPase
MNPFNPSFGEMPNNMLGREQTLAKIRNAFDNNLKDPYRTVLFSGARGIGKTMAIFETPVQISDIQKKMNVSQGYIQQYRARLLETELIYSPSYGKLDFSIPYLKEYLS